MESVNLFLRFSQFLWRIIPFAPAWELSIQTLLFWEQRQKGCLENRFLPKWLVFSLAPGSHLLCLLLSESGDSQVLWGKHSCPPERNETGTGWWSRWEGLVFGGGRDVYMWWMQTFSLHLCSRPMAHPSCPRTSSVPWTTSPGFCGGTCTLLGYSFSHSAEVLPSLCCFSFPQNMVTVFIHDRYVPWSLWLVGLPLSIIYLSFIYLSIICQSLIYLSIFWLLLLIFPLGFG